MFNQTVNWQRLGVLSNSGRELLLILLHNVSLINQDKKPRRSGRGTKPDILTHYRAIRVGFRASTRPTTNIAFNYQTHVIRQFIVRSKNEKVHPKKCIGEAFIFRCLTVVLF